MGLSLAQLDPYEKGNVMEMHRGRAEHEEEGVLLLSQGERPRTKKPQNGQPPGHPDLELPSFRFGRRHF